MNTLLLLLSMMVLQESPGFPYPDFVLEYYPKTVMPGDTLYMKIVANNHYTESIYIREHFNLHDGSIRTYLRDTENQTQSLLFNGLPMSLHSPPKFVGIKPKTSRIIRAMSINVPPLEDLNEPFWEKHLKHLPELGKNETFSLCVAFRPHCITSQAYERSKFQSPFDFQFTFETPLEMKLRPEKEMVLIRNWLENTPKELLPIKTGNDNPTKKVPPMTSQGPFFPKIENIFVKGEKVTQSQFMWSDNRYPAYLNAPETWQEWKELEDSLTPSTMRDEIRLTRILIQYCDTEDANVLKELKDWFTDMNEVQRTAMARSLRDRAVDCYGNDKLLPPFREVYKTIREYDMVPPYEGGDKHLRNLGLIE